MYSKTRATRMTVRRRVIAHNAAKPQAEGLNGLKKLIELIELNEAERAGDVAAGWREAGLLQRGASSRGRGD